MFKKLSGDMDDAKIQIKHSNKTTMSEIMLDWINGKLDTVKEMISKLKYMAKGTIQNGTW